ncbi:MAG: hypothetical protein ABI579_08305, partial [Candidatus Sumerlaeota bacterium]
VLHYLLINGVICHTWPDFAETASGLIPAAFAIPTLAACDYLRRSFPRENAARLGVLAWFGGVALLFITLIFARRYILRRTERRMLQMDDVFTRLMRRHLMNDPDG